MAKVDILNYISDSNILRSTYDTDTNELDITDVPQNLNSVITLGGGGGGGEWTSDGIADMTEPNGDIELSVSAISARAFYGRPITSVNAPNVTQIGNNCFENCTSLASVNMPDLTSTTGSNADSNFMGCSSLTSIHIPNFSTPRLSYTFKGCSSLENIALPSFSKNLYSNAFKDCSKLKMADFTNITDISSGDQFNGCSLFDTLIIRKSSVVSMAIGNNFKNTPFASDGSGGTVYVPESLMTSYQNATNWSAFLAYPNNQIKSIESTHNDPYAPFDMTVNYADGTEIGG